MPSRRSITGTGLIRLMAVMTLVVGGCAPSPKPGVPTRGQSAAQQATDRAACEAWAREEVARTDPRRTGMYIILGTERALARAYATCMERRGYAVR